MDFNLSIAKSLRRTVIELIDNEFYIRWWDNSISKCSTLNTMLDLIEREYRGSEIQTELDDFTNKEDKNQTKLSEFGI